MQARYHNGPIPFLRSRARNYTLYSSLLQRGIDLTPCKWPRGRGTTYQHSGPAAADSSEKADKFLGSASARGLLDTRADRGAASSGIHPIFCRNTMHCPGCCWSLVNPSRRLRSFPERGHSGFGAKQLDCCDPHKHATCTLRQLPGHRGRRRGGGAGGCRLSPGGTIRGKLGRVGADRRPLARRKLPARRPITSRWRHRPALCPARSRQPRCSTAADRPMSRFRRAGRRG